MKKFIAILAGLPVLLLSLLPLPVLYFFGNILFVLVYYVTGYRKHVVRLNMYACFPDVSSVQIYQWQKEFFRHLTRFIVEAIKGITASAPFFEKRVSVDPEIFQQLETFRQQNRNVVVLTGHYGNWEWTAARMARVQGFRKYVVYRSQSSTITDTWISWLRGKGSAELLPESQIRKVLGKNETPCLLVMAADQTPVNVEQAHWVSFMGINTPFHPGPARLSAMLDAVAYYIAVEPVRRGHYRVVYKQLPRDGSPEEFTQQYAEALEETIRANPPYWLWSHRRWKRSGIPGLG